MVENVKIYVRNVYWKSIRMNINSPYFNIVCQKPQAVYDNENFTDYTMGEDIIRTVIQRRTEIIDETWKSGPYNMIEYFIDIDEPDIVIWDHDNLAKVKFPKIYRQDPSQIENRFEILDL